VDFFFNYYFYLYLFRIECFLSLGSATSKECHNLWILGSTSELVNLTILAKKISHLEYPEAKSPSLCSGKGN
jgi:hypothetical protein